MFVSLGLSSEGSYPINPEWASTDTRCWCVEQQYLPAVPQIPPSPHPRVWDLGKGRMACTCLSPALLYCIYWVFTPLASASWFLLSFVVSRPFVVLASAGVPLFGIFVQPADEPHLAVRADPCRGLGCGTPQVPPCHDLAMRLLPVDYGASCIGNVPLCLGICEVGVDYLMDFLTASATSGDLHPSLSHSPVCLKTAFFPLFVFNAGEGKHRGQQYWFQSQERAFAALTVPLKQATRTGLCSPINVAFLPVHDTPENKMGKCYILNCEMKPSKHSTKNRGTREVSCKTEEFTFF